MKAIINVDTGQTYESEEQAIRAGVPAKDIAIRFTTGPFKDRIYRRNSRGQLELMSARKQLHRRVG